MKKILSLVMVIAMIAALAVTTSAAEIPTDGLIGHFKLDGDLVNAVNGEPATPMGKQFSEGMYEDDERTWYAGVDGTALSGSDGEGFCTNVNPGQGDFSMGLWALEVSDPGIIPYMWYGPQDQSGVFGGETWIGIWNVDVAAGWTRHTLTLGTNNPSASRPEVVPAVDTYDPEAGILMQWTHALISAVYVPAPDDASTDSYTITLYINGENMGTKEGCPVPYTGDPETYGDYVYVNGVNAWADMMNTGAIDEVVIYNKALNDDEVAALYGAYETPAQYETLDDFWATMVVTEEDTEAPADDTTAAPVEDDTTAAPADDTTAAPADDTTAAPAEEEGGCGSAMGAAALVALVATLGCAIVKKH